MVMMEEKQGVRELGCNGPLGDCVQTINTLLLSGRAELGTEVDQLSFSHLSSLKVSK